MLIILSTLQTESNGEIRLHINSLAVDKSRHLDFLTGLILFVKFKGNVIQAAVIFCCHNRRSRPKYDFVLFTVIICCRIAENVISPEVVTLVFKATYVHGESKSQLFNVVPKCQTVNIMVSIGEE